MTGKQLNEQFDLDLAHALFHKDGRWYHQLTAFPGGLLDQEGYVRFTSREEFLGDPCLGIDQDVNVRGQLSHHPRYIRFPATN
jgi:5-methylcytosine-specific restriction enzyme A